MPFPDIPYSEYSVGDLVFGLGRTRKYNLENHSFFRDVSVDSPSNIDMFEPFSNKNLLKNAIPFPERQNEFLQSINRHEKYRNLLSVQFTDDAWHNYWNVNQAIRRKCKAGLNWAKEDNIRVHFILDDINIAGVVEKRFFEYGKSATGSELRWLYRNRDDPDVQNVVQFWQSGERVDPPWVANEALWARYQPKSVSRGVSAASGVNDGAVTAASRVARHTSTGEADDFFEQFADLF